MKHQIETAAIEHALKTMKEAEREILRLRHALETIQEMIDERHWGEELVGEIATVLRANGYPLKDVEP